MKKATFSLVVAFWCVLLLPIPGATQPRVVDGGWHHVRNAGHREWTEFPHHAKRSKFSVTFPASKNAAEWAISLRQYDVKLTWNIFLNGEVVGSLVADEKNLRTYVKIPPGTLRDGDNLLEISCTDQQPDDILVGDVTLYDSSPETILSEAHLSLQLHEDDTQERIPGRLTIVNARGTLQQVLPLDTSSLVTRPGFAYSRSGLFRLGIPAGSYTLYATRGPEYGVDSLSIEVNEGDSLDHTFIIKREVATPGWAASDTHIHTLTFSGHGDASVQERAITIAGENIELPVMTDHNVHVDLKPAMIEEQVVRYFTPVIGNEVTTPVGHFNIFPVTADDEVINPRADTWARLEGRMATTNQPRAIILNHGRDVHMNFRPFDPVRHVASAGARLDRWNFFPNAMEVINSGSQQTDQMQLMRDWFGMLNNGKFITPVGSSDSHDVSRYLVGQGRTYIRCNDEDPANIDVHEAVKNFVDGNVIVSLGLFVEIEINDAYGPGELVPGSDKVKVSIKASGPAWLKADHVTLYANGIKIREANIPDGNAAGVKWTGEWNLTAPQHDIFLVAVVEGPAPAVPYWPIAKPYQPASPEWKPHVFALTGAVWIDGDQNRTRNSARTYAETLVRQAGSNTATLIQSLASFDEAIATQAAALLYQNGRDLSGAEVTRALRNASPQTRSGFQKVITDLKHAR